MRREIELKKSLFSKEKNGSWERTAIPHTWNTMDRRTEAMTMIGERHIIAFSFLM